MREKSRECVFVVLVLLCSTLEENDENVMNLGTTVRGSDQIAYFSQKLVNHSKETAVHRLPRASLVQGLAAETITQISKSVRNWQSDVPTDGIIYLGEASPSRLKCSALWHLNIILKQDDLRPQSSITWLIDTLSTHCLSHLRQLTLCWAGVYLAKPVFSGVVSSLI